MAADQNTFYGKQRFKTNPFVEKILQKKISIDENEANLILTKAENNPAIFNDQNHFMAINEYQDLDKESFVKVFTDFHKAHLGLTTAGQTMLSYCMDQMIPGKDKIIIHVDHAVEFCKYKSTAQVYRGLNELITAQVIAASETPGIYFINPTIMFAGSRFSLIKTFVREKWSASDIERMKEQSALFGTIIDIDPQTEEVKVIWDKEQQKQLS